jgi:hypothetical protein
MRAVLLLTVVSFAIAGCNEPKAGPTKTAASDAAPTIEEPPKPAAVTVAVPVGRYQIIHSPHLEKDTMLLDTATGQTWQLTEDPQSGLWWKALTR